MDEKDNVSLIDERIKELAEKLGKTQMGSDEYCAIVKDIAELTKVRETYTKAEQQRLDSNARNDVAEAELVIKQQEAKNGKFRNVVALVTTILTVGGYSATSIYTGWKAYHMEETTLPFRPMDRKSDQLANRIK